MSYKNSVKIFSSNFTLVWKQLAYGLLCFGAVALLSFLLAMPTINLLEAEGWFSKLSGVFELVYTTPYEINATFIEVFTSLGNILYANFTTHWFSYIGFCLTAIILPLYLSGLGIYTLSYVSNSKISSLTNVGYTNTLFTNFKKASLFSLLKLLIDLAFGIVEVGLFFLYLACAKGVFLTIFCLLIFMLLIVFLSGLKLTFLTNFAPLMIEENMSTLKAFRKSFKLGGLHFGRTISNSIIVILTIIAINAFLGIFTIGVGLFITVPATAVFVSVFMVTNYYTVQGKRYYLNDSLIVEPKVVEPKVIDLKPLDNKLNKKGK